jgi:hypothetical protein
MQDTSVFNFVQVNVYTLVGVVGLSPKIAATAVYNDDCCHKILQINTTKTCHPVLLSGLLAVPFRAG